MSNAKSIPMADAQNGNVVHNMSTVSGGGRVMSQKQNSQTPKKTNYLALGVALGVCLGAAVGLALDNMAFMGGGIAIGLSIGAAPEPRNKTNDA